MSLEINTKCSKALLIVESIIDFHYFTSTRILASELFVPTLQNMTVENCTKNGSERTESIKNTYESCRDSTEEDRIAIQDTFQQNRNELRECYDEQLEKPSNPTAEILVKLTIDSNGRVTRQASLSDAMTPEPLEKCVQAKIKSWSFPKARMGEDFVVKLSLSMTQSADLMIQKKDLDVNLVFYPCRHRKIPPVRRL